MEARNPNLTLENPRSGCASLGQLSSLEIQPCPHTTRTRRNFFAGTRSSRINYPVCSVQRIWRACKFVPDCVDNFFVIANQSTSASPPSPNSSTRKLHCHYLLPSHERSLPLIRAPIQYGMTVVQPPCPQGHLATPGFHYIPHCARHLYCICCCGFGGGTPGWPPPPQP